MSTMYEVTTFEFHNRKPSEAQVFACIKNAIKQGQYALDICWGENCLSFNYQPARKYLDGHGWIKNISGDFVAKRINYQLEAGELIL